MSTQIATTWGLSVRGGSSLYLTSTAPFLSKWSPALLWNISRKLNISLWVVFTYKQFNILVQERTIVFNLTGDIQARQTLWEIHSFNAVAQIGFQVTWILLFQNRKILKILKIIFKKKKLRSFPIEKARNLGISPNRAGGSSKIQKKVQSFSWKKFKIRVFGNQRLKNNDSFSS